jgi:hypothetical protein
MQVSSRTSSSSLCESAINEMSIGAGVVKSQNGLIGDIELLHYVERLLGRLFDHIIMLRKRFRGSGKGDIRDSDWGWIGFARPGNRGFEAAPAMMIV